MAAQALHHALTNAHMQVIDGLKQTVDGLTAENGALLELLRAMQAGELKPEGIVITDGGWKLIPLEEEEPHGNGHSDEAIPSAATVS